jgi:hypothetical protein
MRGPTTRRASSGSPRRGRGSIVDGGARRRRVSSPHSPRRRVRSATCRLEAGVPNGGSFSWRASVRLEVSPPSPESPRRSAANTPWSQGGRLEPYRFDKEGEPRIVTEPKTRSARFDSRHLVPRVSSDLAVLLGRSDPGLIRDACSNS